MPPEDEPAWEIIQCSKCASVSKCNPAQLASFSCPTCGTLLNTASVTPNPNELNLDEEEPQAAPTPGLGGALISQLGAQAPEDPNLDAGKIKRTTDEDLVSVAEDRVRVRRKSKRLEKELTGWDGNAADMDDDSDGRKKRLDSRGPSALMMLGYGAIALVSIAFVGLTGYGLYASTREKDESKDPKVPTIADEARASLSDLEAASLDREGSQATYEQARDVAQQFLAAPTWKERLAYVREPERVASLMEAFYARAENEDSAFVHRPISLKGKVAVHKTLMLFMVESEELEKLPLAVERIDEATYRVDWESFVGLSDYPWSEMKTARPTESFLMRARVRKRPYYNYGFQEKDWTSWQLEDRRGDHRLFGYVKRGESLDIEMQHQSVGTGGPVYLLLRVRFPEEAPAPDQLEILEVIAKGWIHPGRD